MCVCVCIHTYIYVHVYINTYINAYIYIYLYIHIYNMQVTAGEVRMKLKVMLYGLLQLIRKVYMPLFSLQLWLKRRTDCALQP